MPRAKRTEEPEDGVLDQEQETEDNSASEAELEVAARIAKRMGHVTQEEWVASGRKPEKWVEPLKWLEDTPQVIKRLQEQRDRAASAAAEAIEEDRRQRRAELEQRLRAEEDPEERVKVARDYANVSGPHPETQAWMRDNPWFDTDPQARAVAAQVVNDMASQGRSIREQLQGATEAVRRRFPEHFGDEAPVSDRAPVRATQLEPRARPAAQPGTRAPIQAANRKKGFSDLPYRVRQDFEATLAKYLKTDAQREKYAAKYWEEQDA